MEQHHHSPTSRFWRHCVRCSVLQVVHIFKFLLDIDTMLSPLGCVYIQDRQILLQRRFLRGEYSPLGSHIFTFLLKWYYSLWLYKIFKNCYHLNILLVVLRGSHQNIWINSFLKLHGFRLQIASRIAAAILPLRTAVQPHHTAIACDLFSHVMTATQSHQTLHQVASDRIRHRNRLQHPFQYCFVQIFFQN